MACASLSCLPNQLCAPTADGPHAGDNVCVPESCVTGYVWDPATGSCVIPTASCFDGLGELTNVGRACEGQGQACVQGPTGPTCVSTCTTLGCATQRRDCTPGATVADDAVWAGCEPGYVANAAGVCELDPTGSCGRGPGSIAAACESRNRGCVELPGGATCGACAAGRATDPRTLRCVEVVACGDGVCFDGGFCHYPQNDAPPRCRPSCTAGQAMTEEGVCVSCGAISCGSDEIHGALVGGPLRLRSEHVLRRRLRRHELALPSQPVRAR